MRYRYWLCAAKIRAILLAHHNIKPQKQLPARAPRLILFLMPSATRYPALYFSPLIQQVLEMIDWLFWLAESTFLLVFIYWLSQMPRQNIPDYSNHRAQRCFHTYNFWCDTGAIRAVPKYKIRPPIFAWAFIILRVSSCTAARPPRFDIFITDDEMPYIIKWRHLKN